MGVGSVGLPYRVHGLVLFYLAEKAGKLFPTDVRGTLGSFSGASLRSARSSDP